MTARVTVAHCRVAPGNGVTRSKSMSTYQKCIASGFSRPSQASRKALRIYSPLKCTQCDLGRLQALPAPSEGHAVGPRYRADW